MRLPHEYAGLRDGARQILAQVGFIGSAPAHFFREGVIPSSDGTSTPARPPSSASSTPRPLRVAMIGRPVAIASSIAIDMPSSREASTKQWARR
jgi:hypothetical protein